MRPGFPIFVALGKGIPALMNSIARLMAGFHFSLKFFLPRLTGQMLADVVQSKSATAGSLDGWGWRELKVLPVSWYDGLARILTKVEDIGDWPDGLLDAYIAMIPKTDGDATPLGQRPLSVLPIVYRVWASTRMVQLEEWFKSWAPDSVFGAGGGRGSVEAWYTSALDIEEFLAGATDSHIHLFVADVLKSFDTVDRGTLIGFWVVLVCLVGFAMLILSTMLMCVCGSTWHLVLVSLGLVMAVFLRVVP